MTGHVRGGEQPGNISAARSRAGLGSVGGDVELPTGDAALTDVVRLRVRYSESDQMGITYHARYLDWFVIGRTELLRAIGLPYAQLERAGLLLPVLEANCRYVESTRYDDVVQLETKITSLGRTRVTFRYEVWRLPPKGPGMSRACRRRRRAEEAGRGPQSGARSDGASQDGARRDSVPHDGMPQAGALQEEVAVVQTPVLVTSGETRHVFVDADHRPVDVRKRFPDVWDVLRPLAERLASPVSEHVVTEGP